MHHRANMVFMRMGDDQAKQHDLAFIPLGGTGEIGMNLNVYRCDGALLAVDCGLGFAGPDQPEADVMVPDPVWLAENRDASESLRRSTESTKPVL